MNSQNGGFSPRGEQPCWPRLLNPFLLMSEAESPFRPTLTNRVFATVGGQTASHPVTARHGWTFATFSLPFIHQKLALRGRDMMTANSAMPMKTIRPSQTQQQETEGTGIFRPHRQASVASCSNPISLAADVSPLKLPDATSANSRRLLRSERPHPFAYSASFAVPAATEAHFCRGLQSSYPCHPPSIFAIFPATFPDQLPCSH